MFFLFHDTATTEIYTLSLHDALPIFPPEVRKRRCLGETSLPSGMDRTSIPLGRLVSPRRSEEHTSELQSRQYLVCRLLLEKKKKLKQYNTPVPPVPTKFTATLRSDHY